MKSWLNKGRPFSLIALDTMANCLAVKNDPFIEELSPKILRTDINEIEPILYDYLQKDGVPRVKTKVGIIVKNKEAIFE